MTEQEKQVLAGLCLIEIKRWKAAADSNPNMRYMVELMDVALASLTAESGWIKCSYQMPGYDTLCLGVDGMASCGLCTMTAAFSWQTLVRLKG